MDRGGTLQKLNRSPATPRTQEDITTTMEAITMEDIRTMEEVHTTTVALRMAMGMEKQQPETFQPRDTRQEGSESHYLFQVREDWALRQRLSGIEERQWQWKRWEEAQPFQQGTSEPRARGGS